MWLYKIESEPVSLRHLEFHDRTLYLQWNQLPLQWGLNKLINVTEPVCQELFFVWVWCISENILDKSYYTKVFYYNEYCTPKLFFCHCWNDKTSDQDKMDNAITVKERAFVVPSIEDNNSQDVLEDKWTAQDTKAA